MSAKCGKVVLMVGKARDGKQSGDIEPSGYGDRPVFVAVE
jgi:hypothetical protein